MRLVGAAPFTGSKATLDRPPWKGADGGLRILLVLRFLHNYYDYSMTATIGSDTILQRSTRAGTMVTGIFITLAIYLEHWLSLERHVQYHISSDYSHIMLYFIRLFPHYASSVNVPIMSETMPIMPETMPA